MENNKVKIEDIEIHVPPIVDRVCSQLLKLMSEIIAVFICKNTKNE